MIGSLKMVGIETLKSKYRSFKKINCRIVNKIFFFFLWLLKVFFLLKHFLTVDKIPKTVKFDRIKKKKKNNVDRKHAQFTDQGSSVPLRNCTHCLSVYHSCKMQKLEASIKDTRITLTLGTFNLSLKLTSRMLALSSILCTKVE